MRYHMQPRNTKKDNDPLNSAGFLDLSKAFDTVDHPISLQLKRSLFGAFKHNFCGFNRTSQVVCRIL